VYPGDGLPPPPGYTPELFPECDDEPLSALTAEEAALVRLPEDRQPDPR